MIERAGAVAKLGFKADPDILHHACGLPWLTRAMTPGPCRPLSTIRIFSTLFAIPRYRKIDLRIFGEKELGGTVMFRELPWRSALKDLALRGGLSLIVCALAALCVGGFLSALAANLGPKARTNDADQASCKAGTCVTKGKGHGPRLANAKSERRASQ
jgi:hypothetical protein